MNKTTAARIFVRQPLAPLALALALTLVSGGSAVSASPSSNAYPTTSASVGGAVSNATTGSDAADDESGLFVYTVVLREPALAAYEGGGPANLKAVPRTRSAGGRERLDVQSTEARDYVSHLQNVQADFTHAVTMELGRQVNVVNRYQHALNALVLRLTPAEADRLRQRPDVELVERERQLKLHTFDTPEFLGVPALWNNTSAPNGTGYKGEGIVVGVIDTGINYLSNSFKETGDDGYTVVNPLGTGNFLGRCQPGGANVGHCNGKLIGIYDTVSTSGANGRDLDGHGSHTASTAAGGVVTGASFAGGTFNISGIAPHANIIAYKACCTSIGLDSAINQTVADGIVDVINYSIGGPNDGPWLNTSDLAFLNATNAGIFVAQSAGNDGPGPATTDSYAPWVTTVAAQTPRSVPGFLLSVPGWSGSAAMVPGASPAPTQAFTNLPLIESPNFADGSNDGCAAYPANTFRRPQTVEGVQGIAVLHLDQNASNCASGARRTAAANAGAIAVIYVDPEYINLGASGASYSLEQAAWTAIKAAVGDVSGTGAATASIGFPITAGPRTPNILAGFSSRGPVPWGVLKPEVAAPGTNILAAISPTAATGYTNAANQPATRALIGPNSGTSMASPHVAGAAALVRQARPEWRPMEVKSALMTTAKPTQTRVDGTIVDANQQGAGLIDPATAIRAGLVFDENAANFRAADPALGGRQETLNLASYYHAACVDKCIFPRSVRSTGKATTWTVAVNGLPAGSFSLDKTSFRLGATGQTSYSLTFDTAGLAIGQFYYGELTLTPADPSIPVARLPIAIRSATARLLLDTQEIAATVPAGTSIERAVGISNAGNPTLNWSIPTDTLRATLISRKRNSSGRSNRTVVTAATATAIESTNASNSYVFDWFDIAGAGTRLVSLEMSGFNNDASIAQLATQIAFRVYGDNNGTPNGRPGSTVAGDQPPVFQWPSAAGGGPIDAAGLTAGDDVRLDLAAAGAVSPSLDVGRYWLNFAPSISGTANNYFMLFSDIPGKQPTAQATQPNAASAANKAYVATSTNGTTNTGLAMKVVVDAVCGAPWLSYSATNGGLGLNASTSVQVTLDATGLAAGVYSAYLCVSGNGTSPDFFVGSHVGTQDAYLIPVKMTVTQAPVALSATGAATPASAPAGTSTLLTVNVTPGTLPASSGIGVTADLTSIGGDAAQAFFDDGSNGDATAGDGIWSYAATIAPATGPGSKSLPVTVVDAQSRQATTTIDLEVQAANDVIFRNGFDGTGDGSGNVVTRALGVAVFDSFDGTCINWLTGVVRDNLANCAGDHFNPRKSNTGNLVFGWIDTATNAGVASGTAYALLAAGATVGPDAAFITADTSLPSAAFRPAGGVDGYLGFRFTNGGTGQVNYGYVRIDTRAAVGTTGIPATIVGYAYDSSGAAITIPAG